MGTSTNGILAYGYDFGSPDELKLTECGESGYFKTSWWDDEHEVDGDEEESDLVGVMTKRLYASIPGVAPVQHAWECEDAVKEHLGVWFESYCSGEYPMYILTTHVIMVYRGDTVPIDPAQLLRVPFASQWDERLAEALRVLDVHPTQVRAQWLLASDWSW